MNLISNAGKFVPKINGKIKVAAKIIKQNASVFLSISVTDNGPGISQEDIPKLFQSFSKLEATKNLNPSGTGLGLCICKQICNSLGGDITVSSIVNQFTKFEFWVPVQPLDDRPGSASHN
jgi:two-component system, sensor histidine kinase and response regulator